MNQSHKIQWEGQKYFQTSHVVKSGNSLLLSNLLPIVSLAKGFYSPNLSLPVIKHISRAGSTWLLGFLG